MTSYTGPFFNELYLIKYNFATGVFSTLGPSMLQFMRTGSALYISLIALLIIVQPQKGKERGEGLLVSMACFAVAILLLSQNGTTSNVLEVFWIIEDTALAISVEILQKLPTYSDALGSFPYPLDLPEATIAVGNEQVVNGYAVLASLIERQMLDVINLFGQIAYGEGTFIGPAIVARVVMCIIGILPFLFVLGIFAAFMAEAMFKYVAMATAAPILVALFPVKFFRPFSSAGIRILIGAFFTIIFATGAMGFTMVAVDNFQNGIKQKLALATQASQDIDSVRFRYHCNKYMSWTDQIIPSSEQWEILFGGISPGDLQPPIPEAVCKDTIERAKKGSWIVFDPAFLMLIVIGFLSVLLHLSAKTLASNISGANDGPGPAAAVVMAAKAATAGGAGIAYKYGGGTLFGQGGFGSSVSDVMQGNRRVTAGGVQGFGQSLASHGLVGTAAGFVNPFRGSATPPGQDTAPGFGNIGSNRFSTGGGNGSMFGSAQDKRDFANIMAEALKQAGISRNRDGS